MNRSKLIRKLVTIFILGAFAIYISQNIDRFKDLEIVSPLLFLPAICVYLINVYSAGQVVEVAIKAHGVRLSKMEVFGLSVLTRFTRYIAPGYVGITVRAFYLKRKYKLSLTKFSASLGLSTIIQFFIAGIIAVAIFFEQTSGTNSNGTFIIISALLVFFLGILLLPINRLMGVADSLHEKKATRITRLLASSIKEFETVRKSPKLLVESLYWMIAALGSSTLMLMIFFHILGGQINFIEALFITCLTSWTMIIEITPGAIGVREGLMAFGAELMGVPVPITIASALLMRVLFLIVSALFSLYYAPKLLGTSVTNIDKVDIDD